MRLPDVRARLWAATFLGAVASILIVVFVAGQRPTDTEQPPASPDPAALSSPDPEPSFEPTLVPSVTPSAPVSSPAIEPSATPPSTSPKHRKLMNLLAKVKVVPSRPQLDGYDRSCSPGDGCVFGTSWTDDSDAPKGRNGCDTRNDVLRQDLVDITVDEGTNGCVVRTGTLLDPYTGRTISFLRGPDTSRSVEIDHVIPLAAAWDMGAANWSLERRIAFANDVETELIAVDGPANQQKSDSTPASWLPPNKAYRCDYGIKYLTASLVWDLPVTRADVEVLTAAARNCA